MSGESTETVLEGATNLMETVNIVKRGETPISISVGRSRHGAFLRIKTHPMVEDFIRALGSGDQEDVKVHGRYWAPIPSSETLLVYNLPSSSNPGTLYSEDGLPFVIDKPGRPIIMETNQDSEGRILGGSDRPVLNLSILRLVGSSEGIGKSLGIKGVFTEEELRNIKTRLGIAARRFYLTYLKPVTFTVTLHSQEF